MKMFIPYSRAIKAHHNLPEVSLCAATPSTSLITLLINSSTQRFRRLLWKRASRFRYGPPMDLAPSYAMSAESGSREATMNAFEQLLGGGHHSVNHFRQNLRMY